ncbi:hypothetical protein [Acinetobacter bereziniae]|uniref:hypothetical protein n=1 Tax=Acinetobacter bereziniae TaxID=106648 RepID=UPI003009FCB5
MSENSQEKRKQPLYRNKILWVIIYLLIIIIYTGIYIKSDGINTMLSSNELGDFLAGVFAPLAFLFLFLGYLQQGEAIKKSNQNIEKQLLQQERMLKLHEEERRQQEHAAQPIFDLNIKADKSPKIIHDGEQGFVPLPDSYGTKITFKIQNKGEKISEVCISLSGDISEILFVENFLNTDQTIELTTLLTKSKLESFKTENINFDLEIVYRTYLGIRYIRKYSVIKSIKYNHLNYNYDADYVRLD